MAPSIGSMNNRHVKGGHTVDHLVFIGKLTALQATLLLECEDGAQPHGRGAVGVDVEEEREVVRNQKLTRLLKIPHWPTPTARISCNSMCTRKEDIK